MQIKRKILPAALASALTCALFLSACSKEGAGDQAPAAQAPQLVEVGVHTVKFRDVVLTTELAGRTSPFLISEVRPQINGIIQKRFFTEGADVKAGAPLYQIDPSLYRATYESARASRAKAEANLASAKAKAARYTELVALNAVSRQDNDDVHTALKQAEADVLATRAALETARINLAYTSIVSPISGRIGKSDYTPGALVTANQPAVLATVQQLDPIYVDVTQSSNEWLRLKRDMETGRLQSSGDNQALVELVLSDDSVYALKGHLKFSDVTVDQSTGSITLRAEFTNPTNELLPGMYVRARLVEGTKTEAILVPQQGVTRDAKGDAVALVVAEDGTVSQRKLVTERAIGNEWLISEGLKPGEKIIIEGLQRVRIIPGAPPPKVKAVEKDMSMGAPSNAPSSAASMAPAPEVAKEPEMNEAKPADEAKPAEVKAEAIPEEVKPAQTENVSAKQ